MNDRNPILIGTAEEVDLLQPRVRAMMEKPGVYILGDTTRPGVTVVLAVIEPWQAFFMSPDSESVDPELFLPTVTFHGPYFGSEEPHPAPVVPEGMVLAYGYLWHAGNPSEVRGDNLVLPPEIAAAKARLELRGLLTTDQRCRAIDKVRAMLAAAQQQKGSGNG